MRSYHVNAFPSCSHKPRHTTAHLLHKARHAMLDSKARHVFGDFEVLTMQQNGLTGRTPRWGGHCPTAHMYAYSAWQHAFLGRHDTLQILSNLQKKL